MRADEILDKVAREEEVGIKQLLAPTRCSPHISKARQRAMREVHAAFPRMSWTAIGELFGRDRTTVRYACKGRKNARSTSTVRT